jgi:hypothetical protein
MFPRSRFSVFGGKSRLLYFLGVVPSLPSWGRRPKAMSGQSRFSVFGGKARLL